MTDKEVNERWRKFERACDEHIARHGRKASIKREQCQTSLSNAEREKARCDSINARVYISGPMSGVDRKLYLEMFKRAEQSLRSKGYTKIVNPIRVWACRWPWLYRLVGYRLTLLYDLWLLMRCDQIYKLPGWRDSKGANIESCVAYHFKIWPVSDSLTKNLDKRLAKLKEKWGTRNVVFVIPTDPSPKPPKK